MNYIMKIRMINYKKFKKREMIFNSDTNILIGDNEAGKSSILQAIDLVLSGSRAKIETIGLDKLINLNIISEFMSSDRLITNLPKLTLELYLSEQMNPLLNGKNNTAGVECDGIRLICEPDLDLSNEILEILSDNNSCFPFEYYTIRFSTFADQTYSGYRKFLKHLSIDSSAINTEYASREYIKLVYSSIAKPIEKAKHQSEYRKSKAIFKRDNLNEINSRIEDFEFELKTDTKSNLVNDIIITEDSISIDNKGKGKQCIIKTEFALQKSNSDTEVILLEEPENHLSHTNMNMLIDKIITTSPKQVFITTHNSLISTRLNLRKAILLNSNSSKSISLSNIPVSTSKFFMKAPDNNILEFILSPKTILVEGDAEFILMEKFVHNVTNLSCSELGIHVISVDGTSFKRYFDIATELKLKVIAIRDNDGDYLKNCVELYNGYLSEYIQVFSDKSNDRSTFEICIYKDNTEVCNELFASGRVSLSVQDYMLKNKADVAFELLEKKGENLYVPTYIKEAIEWIRK